MTTMMHVAPSRIRTPLRIAKPPANCASPHEVPDNDRHVHESGEPLRAGTSEGTEENLAAVVEENESTGDSED
jgi:hypothetical protein